MPLSAIRHARVNQVLPLRELAAKIVELVGTPSTPTEPPESLVRECAAGTMELPAPEAFVNLNLIGSPSSYACPDCGGPLWRIHASQPPRYRCHTGHGFSLRSLDGAQEEVAEAALRSAIRLLEERRSVLAEISAAALVERRPDEARRVQALAERAGEQALVLRSLSEAACRLGTQNRPRRPPLPRAPTLESRATSEVAQ
jgi:two-component system chemotaxis response regulator CheB